MQVLCLEVVLKSHKKHKRQNEVFGRIGKVWFRVVQQLCGVINRYFSCMLMLQRGVFEYLVRNAIVNASEEVSWCEEPFRLLVLVSCFTVKNQLMLWNKAEYCRKAGFPQLKSCFLKRHNQVLFFNKTMLLPTLQRPSKRGLRTHHKSTRF